MPRPTSEHPNIVFLMADQFHADCLGFLGRTIVRTPNLDALAARGMHFDNMYACSAICSPSRASFFTGTYLRTHEQFFNNSDLRREFPSLITVLKEHGYTTFQCGKNHLSPTLARHFDEMWTVKTSYRRYLEKQGLTPDSMNAVVDRQFASYVSDIPEEHQNEVWTADRAIDFIRSPRSQDRPFFMWCTFQRPHAPHAPPESLDELYDPGDIPVNWESYYAFENSKLQNRPMREDFWKLGSVRHDVSIFQKAVCRYYALITLIDREIGRILAALDECGAGENTIVIFTADHGDFAGNYGQLGKNLPGYDDLIRIPFIYHDPRRKGDCGQVVEGMYQNVDLFPSLLDRLGVDCPPTVQGRSFLDALDGWPGSGRDYVFSETGVEKTIRSRDWKLNFCAREPEKSQLFRMGVSPDETTNLWDDPQYTEVKSRLMAELMAWMARCEQTIVMDRKWEEYLPTRWNEWLTRQPRQNSCPASDLPNVR